jgi:putative membrane protein
VPQSRAAAASKTRTRAQQLAITVLALLLIALLGFYSLVTGRITDGSAKTKDGASQASAGASS